MGFGKEKGPQCNAATHSGRGRVFTMAKFQLVTMAKWPQLGVKLKPFFGSCRIGIWGFQEDGMEGQKYGMVWYGTVEVWYGMGGQKASIRRPRYRPEEGVVGHNGKVALARGITPTVFRFIATEFTIMPINKSTRLFQNSNNVKEFHDFQSIAISRPVSSLGNLSNFPSRS